MVPLMVLALTLWGEARSEGEAGIRAVASVIYTRAKGSPERFKAVCFAPKQFSCWNGKRGEKLYKSAPQGEAWEICKKVAGELADGRFTPSNSATHYMTIRLYDSPRRPKWADKMVPEVVVGGHVFLSRI